MSPRRWLRPLLWTLLGAALLGVAAAAIVQQTRRNARAAIEQRAAALPSYGTVPDQLFTGSDGRARRLGTLAGQPWIADFIFTRCGSSCPLLSARLAGLDRSLPPAIHLVSVSVDPAHDTPPVLATYARSFHASPRWLFLTGDPAGVRRLSHDTFKLALEPGGTLPAGPTEAVFHSTRFILVDTQQTIRGAYDALDPAALERLTEDARALAASVPIGAGGEPAKRAAQ